MFTCQYCRASYQNFQTICSGCGAPLKTQGEEGLFEKELPPELAGIWQICKGYGDQSAIFSTGKSAATKVGMAEKSFESFPSGKDIFLFCDTTPMGSGIWGFLLCEDGIYWKNNANAPSAQTYLSWQEISKRTIRVNRFALELGQGAVISLAGMRKYENREKVFQFFRDLKSFLDE